MAMTVDDFKARLEGLQQELAAIDIPAAEKAAADATAHANRLAGDCETINAGAISFDAAGDVQRRIAEKDQALSHAKALRLQAPRLEQRQRDLRREIEGLSRMIFAQQRIEQAEQAAEAVQSLVTSASAAVTGAKKTVATLDELIAQEQAAFAMARDGAAAQLLATVKAGGNADKVKTPTLDKVATLELAKEEAQHELAAAESALAAAKKQAAAARGAVNVARADQTAMAHELAFAAYCDALVEHQVAYAIAHRQGFYPPNVIEATRPRVEKRLVALGL